MLGPNHFRARASELEAAAERVSDPVIKAGYLDLAKMFLEMASLSMTCEDQEAVRLAERMVGNSKISQ